MKISFRNQLFRIKPTLLIFISDCFINRAELTGDFVVADDCPGGGAFDNIKDEYKCQKQCQKCESCQFFKFDPNGHSCDLYKFKTASWVLTGEYQSLDYIWGPRICGSDSLISFNFLINRFKLCIQIKHTNRDC